MEKSLIVLVSLTIILALIPGFLTGLTKTRVVEVVTKPTTTLPIYPTRTGELRGKETVIKVPAVDEEGNGVVTLLKVGAVPGEGRVLVDINQLLFWVDTQYSIRVARLVAENFTGRDFSNVDLTYAIETNASLIGGESAGGALTIATIAAIENKSINQSVMMTGTINKDGSIGQIGAVVEKAEAAKETGATLFLVPPGQGVQTNYEPVRKCEEIGPITYCRTEYKAERIDVSEEAGIEVKEVSNIKEALKYFLK